MYSGDSVADVVYASIEQLASDLIRMRDDWQQGSRRRGGCALVIGAGCSKSAGIPTASGFVDKAFEHYRERFGSTKVTDYADCMAHLLPNQRLELVRKLVNVNTLNLAHLAIAQLVRERFVRHVLTTNFDSLAVHACAQAGVDPAVFDYTAIVTEEFAEEKVDGPAIFHLHGQHSGIIQINTDDEFAKHGGSVFRRIFEMFNNQCIWIVAGFSGLNNPTLEQLLRLPEFPNGLYWVAHNNDLPKGKVIDDLKEPAKAASVVIGYDADLFFVTLARMLRCQPPEPFSAPFDYLGKLLGRLRIPDEWKKSTEQVKRETAEELTNALARVNQIRGLVEMAEPSVQWGTEGASEVPEPHAQWRVDAAPKAPTPHTGLILSLPVFSGRGQFATAGELLGAVGDPDFRPRALQTNWGPLIVAVEHHAAQLRHCWVVCSPQAAIDFPFVAELLDKLVSRLVVHSVSVTNPYDIQNVQDTIKHVYDYDVAIQGLGSDDVVADITSGLSSLTSGMILATLDEDRAIEYLRQDTPLVTGGVALTREEIMNQRILIAISTSGSMVREAVVREALR